MTRAATIAVARHRRRHPSAPLPHGCIVPEWRDFFDREYDRLMHHTRAMLGAEFIAEGGRENIDGRAQDVGVFLG